MTWRAVLRHLSFPGAPRFSCADTPRLSLPLAFLLVAFAAACSEAPTAAPVPPDALAAKGGTPGPPSGGGGDDDGTTSSDPTVEDTDPDSAPQDTTLDVRVFGTSFDAGSAVELLLDGNSTKKVKTNSTAFVSDTELVANITIAADAEPDLYDVQVTTSKGKKGVGIEEFEVVGPTTDLETATAESGPGLYDDGKGFYLGEFVVNTKSSNTSNGNYNTRPQCDEGRSMDLRLPTDADGNPAWPFAGPYSDCQGDGKRSQFHVPGLLFAACPQGSWCPIGTDGHQEGSTNFSPDLNYFFVVDTENDGFDKRLSARSDDQPHNVVWTDGTFRVTWWGSDGTPCRWEITAGTADLWSGDTQILPGQQPLSLWAAVHRVDGPCAF